ncbi:MAG: hypothetical protein Q9M91_02980 [Candidatus Dojkabacteria bacterium]|nr:hypothetical protein [Candidatus Dojkabacteria bacterium]MDQ7020788.1 hypothetical protein [Candidatus Dojkabacteria bacterium]
MIPEEFKCIFWDVDFSELRLDSKREFITSRILERGNKNAVKWIFDSVSLSEIRRIVKINLNLSNSTVNFWTNVLNIDGSSI